MPELNSSRAHRPDLLELATKIAGWAKDGEQVEAFVTRGRDTDIRIYEGGIEQLSTADTEGAGEYDPVRHMKSPTNLTDQQIADIVAYLQTLK
mgnify:CR=1 FL=1